MLVSDTSCVLYIHMLVEGGVGGGVVCGEGGHWGRGVVGEGQCLGRGGVGGGVLLEKDGVRGGVVLGEGGVGESDVGGRWCWAKGTRNVLK